DPAHPSRSRRHACLWRPSRHRRPPRLGVLRSLPQGRDGSRGGNAQRALGGEPLRRTTAVHPYRGPLAAKVSPQLGGASRVRRKRPHLFGDEEGNPSVLRDALSGTNVTKANLNRFKRSAPCSCCSMPSACFSQSRSPSRCGARTSGAGSPCIWASVRRTNAVTAISDWTEGA